MEMQVAVKVKLNLANADIASSFTNTMEQYRLACNYVSGYIFNHNFDNQTVKHVVGIDRGLRFSYYLWRTRSNCLFWRQGCDA